MLRPRLIVSLLLSNNALVKTINFKDPKYIGDPLNAVRIFNEKNVDELFIADIDVTREKKSPNFNLISKISQECRMPICYGGGIKNIEDIERIINSGVEKVSISSAFFENPLLVTRANKKFGSQSIVICLDVKKSKFSRKYFASINNGKKLITKDLFSIIEQLEELGAGELIINSVEKDGMRSGYDLNLCKKISKITNLPITFLGGASSLDDFKELWETCGIVGAAAGSLFVFKGKFRAVLINYPTNKDKKFFQI